MSPKSGYLIGLFTLLTVSVSIVHQISLKVIPMISFPTADVNLVLLWSSSQCGRPFTLEVI